MAGSNTALTSSPTSSRRSPSGCGSTGWVYGLLASHQWLIACLAPEAQDEVWARPQRARDRQLRPGRTGSGGGRRLPALRRRQLLQRLRQRAVAVPRRHDPASGWSGKARIFSLRSADCTIDDNWHTMGLAGTGSKTIVARDAFVPAHRTVTFAATFRRQRARDARRIQIRSIGNPSFGRASDRHRLAVARHGGGRARRFPRHGGACAPHAVRSPAATAAWPSSRPCRCASPRRAP